MLTWVVVGALAVGVYGQRALGAALVRTERVGDRWQAVLASLPLAIIAAVVALQTFTSKQQLTVDARLAGLAVAALCAWRRLPMLVTVLAAAATTAAVRRFG
jgi:uncharacterized membrane protein